jgi:hypothetical protein
MDAKIVAYRCPPKSKPNFSICVSAYSASVNDLTLTRGKTSRQEYVRLNGAYGNYHTLKVAMAARPRRR